MNRISNLLPITIVLLMAVIGCKKIQTPHQTTLIPRPNHIQFKNGYFSIRKGVKLKSEQAVREERNLLDNYLQNLNINLNETSTNEICIILSKKLEHNAYELKIEENRIELKSGEKEGLKYGIQTLRQLVFHAINNNSDIPCQQISDAPSYKYRGMHLDVARHFMPVEFVKKYLDIMAILKMNYFHWHLVDDQGWRIEIKKYPKLTEIGAKRKETLIGHGGNPPFKYDGKPHEGYYTQTQIKDIVTFAQKRGITIIPEIELPGHAQSAIAAYPELGVTGEKIDVWTRWGVSPYIYNVEESTFKFLEEVLTEVAELFPGKYIHIGGDEAVKDQWKTSPKVQQRIKELDVKNEAALQSYFIQRIANFLHTKNKTIIGWDEILEGGAPKNAVVTFWRSWIKPSPALKAAHYGHKIIFTPSSLCYFDHYQTTLKDSIEPPAIGGCTPVDSLYIKNPVRNNLPDSLKHLVWGAQGNVWTEYMKTPNHVEHMVMPRMAALAEILWTTQEKQNFPDFKQRFYYFAKWLDTKQVNYAKYIIENDETIQNTKYLQSIH